MRYQPIYDIAELCYKKGLTEVVLCPGSRCAPLTLAFTRNKNISTRTFSDERSAGFIGLGMAQQTKNPVILVCTSGSAAYNFAPAVAEAFFAQTPLIIFTADRPAEWIGQHDGQTIMQSEIFGKHVKRSYQPPQDYDHSDSLWAINRIVNEAINLAMQQPYGPVHINAPFREPLYPSPNETITYSDSVRVINQKNSSSLLTEEQKHTISEKLKSFHRIVVVAGQNDFDSGLTEEMEKFRSVHGIPIIADIISNIALPEIIIHSDLFLGQAPDSIKDTLKPDLLITFGKSLVSKNLKNYLRKYTAIEHWHIQENGIAADTFKNMTHVWDVHPTTFFSFLSTVPVKQNFEQQKQINFTRLWDIEERRAIRVLNDFHTLENLTELEVVNEVLSLLPEGSDLHLANSMSVRYANIIGLSNHKKKIRVHANRGTSGIDGCTSTAVGHALMSGNLNILITGDLAFFYDRNAFWHNYKLPNLRILLLNNHGGLIFNMIDGPASLPEAAEYFITEQKLKADKLCAEFGFDHLKLDSKRKIKNILKDFFDPDSSVPKIIELETDVHINRSSFDNLKQKLKLSYES